jgi:hypothetical protein
MLQRQTPCIVFAGIGFCGGKLVAHTFYCVFVGHKRVNLAFVIRPILNMMFVSSLVMKPSMTVALGTSAYSDRGAVALIIFYAFKKLRGRKFG